MTKKASHADVMLTPEMPADAVRQGFARRLQRTMISKGWTQSELARRAAQHTPDKRMIRDNISKYIRGKVLPGPIHLAALCKALGVDPDTLLPARASSAGQEHPAMSIQNLQNGNAWLRVNQAVPMPVALKVATLLTEDKD